MTVSGLKYKIIRADKYAIYGKTEASAYAYICTY